MRALPLLLPITLLLGGRPGDRAMQPAAGSVAPGPRSLDQLLTPFTARNRGRREWRTLQRLGDDPAGEVYPALGYAWLTLGGQRLLVGRVVSARGSGYRQESWVLLAADDSLARRPLWRARALERWATGPLPHLPPPFRFRGCMELLGDSALVYVRAATRGTPREVLQDALSPPAGAYRLAGMRMRRAGPAPEGALRRCLARSDEA